MNKFDSRITSTKEWLGSGSINIFGRPFAGKDTQAEKLASLYGAEVMGGGVILRNSTIPDDINHIMHAGGLIPSDAYVDIVLPYLSSEEFQGKPLILSSVGRMDGEQVGVIAATEAAEHPLKAVVYLDIDEDTVRERWHAHHAIQDRGLRHDDSEASLERRLEEFRTKTLPVIDDYRTRGMLIEIDGKRSEKDVTVSLIEELARRALSA